MKRGLLKNYIPDPDYRSDAEHSTFDEELALKSWGPIDPELKIIFDHLAVSLASACLLVKITSGGANIIPDYWSTTVKNKGESQTLRRCAERAISKICTGPEGPGITIIADAGRFTIASFCLYQGTVQIAALEPSTPDPNGTHISRLLPFVSASIQQWIHAQDACAKVFTLRHALDVSDDAIVLLNDIGEVAHANMAATHLFNADSGIRICRDRMACQSLSDTFRLQAAIEHCKETALSGQPVCPVISVQRPGRRALAISLASLPRQDAASADLVSTIAYIFDPERDSTRTIEPACKLYGLSLRETAITCALVNGSSLNDAADQLGLAEQTARSYLKQVFLKTDTKRQGDLVQLMLRSAVRTKVSGRFHSFS
jgi:DNA-binding CsgD family transcriptional regulator